MRTPHLLASSVLAVLFAHSTAAVAGDPGPPAAASASAPAPAPTLAPAPAPAPAPEPTPAPAPAPEPTLAPVPAPPTAFNPFGPSTPSPPPVPAQPSGPFAFPGQYGTVPWSPAQDQTPPAFDWLAPSAGIGLGVAGVFALSGAIVLARGGGSDYCGRSGCVERPDYLSINTGASLLGASAGFGLVSGITLLGGLLDPPGPGEVRRNQPMMVAGYVLTSMSAASIGLTIAQAATFDPSGSSFETAWPFLVGTFITGGVGIPLMVAGANVDTPQDREYARLTELARQRPALVGAPEGEQDVGVAVAGGILTGLGGVFGLAGTVLVVGDLAAGFSNFPGFIALVAGLPSILVGGIFTGIGVPVLISGLKREPAGPPVAAPEVDVGPGGITARWRF